MRPAALVTLGRSPSAARPPSHGSRRRQNSLTQKHRRARACRGHPPPDGKRQLCSAPSAPVPPAAPPLLRLPGPQQAQPQRVPRPPRSSPTSRCQALQCVPGRERGGGGAGFRGSGDKRDTRRGTWQLSVMAGGSRQQQKRFAFRTLLLSSPCSQGEKTGQKHTSLYWQLTWV